LAGQYTRGHTTIDWFGQTGEAANVNVVMELDPARLWELLQAAIV
jgi:inosine-uridine nucleoside N-ribohydrolase